jgi:hypothetical protein
MQIPLLKSSEGNPAEQEILFADSKTWTIDTPEYAKTFTCPAGIGLKMPKYLNQAI